MLGFLRRQRFARERQPERAGLADQSRQHPRAAAVRNEADGREGLDEFGALGGDDDVPGIGDVGCGCYLGGGRHGIQPSGSVAQQRA